MPASSVPSIFIGAMTFKWLLFGGGFGESIFLNAEHEEMLKEIGESVGDWAHFGVHALQNPVFYLLAAGVSADDLARIRERLMDDCPEAGIDSTVRG